MVSPGVLTEKQITTISFILDYFQHYAMIKFYEKYKTPFLDHLGHLLPILGKARVNLTNYGRHHYHLWVLPFYWLKVKCQ